MLSLGVSAQSDIVINEFMASNDSLSGISDPAGGYPDWIEIHNRTDLPVDLGGYMVSDNYTVIDKFIFPAGTFIEAQGYVIIWADKDLEEEGFHADFRLQAEGERILLSDPEGGYLDSIGYGQQETNVSYARIPNGTGDFTFRAPTHGFNNEMTSIEEPDFIESVTIGPSPSEGFLRYNLAFLSGFEKKSDFSLRIYDNHGIFAKDLTDENDLFDNQISGVVDLSSRPNGFYYLVMRNGKSTITRKFLLQK